MNKGAIKQAAFIINSGGVVAFPTETVYGLGADATNQQAALKIFQLKNRPKINPLIVHTSTLAMAEEIAEFNPSAYILAKHFWPGPLSLVLPLKNNAKIASCVLAGKATVALRVPAHPVAQELITQARCPIAAPSANLSGYISATLDLHVAQDFADQQVFILQNNAERCCGLESTIIDSTSDVPLILRYGVITQSHLMAVLKKVQVMSALTKVKAIKALDIKAPGMLIKHYSPHTKLRLNAEFLVADKEVGLNFGSSKLLADYALNLSVRGDLAEAAFNLYHMLRLLDEYALKHKRKIAVAAIPNTGIGLAINDRLKRAAS